MKWRRRGNRGRRRGERKRGGKVCVEEGGIWIATVVAPAQGVFLDLGHLTGVRLDKISTGANVVVISQRGKGI